MHVPLFVVMRSTVSPRLCGSVSETTVIRAHDATGAMYRSRFIDVIFSDSELRRTDWMTDLSARQDVLPMHAMNPIALKSGSPRVVMMMPSTTGTNVTYVILDSNFPENDKRMVCMCV